MNRIITIFLSLATLLFVSCQQDKFNPEKHLSSKVLEFLMVDVTTFMGKKPKSANHQTRWEEQYKPYYTKYSREFILTYMATTPDGYYYFYVIRPARSVHGNQRGVGGRMKLDNEQKISEFEELFNTRILPMKELKETGLVLFKEMVEAGHANEIVKKRELIEWPDERCVYDKSINDWVYL